MQTPEDLCPRDIGVEPRTLTLGKDLFHAIENSQPSLLDPQRYSARLMEWAMADDDFRTALFRFVDVLPGLESSASVIRMAQEYFLPVADRFPGLLKWGLKMDPDGLQAKAAAFFIRKQIATMGQQFILGETPFKALSALRKIRKSGRAFTVDLLGEACLSEEEAAVYRDRYVELIHELGKATFDPVMPEHPGDANPINVSVKLSALSSHTKPILGTKAVASLAPSLRAIFKAARQYGGFVYVDMESYAKREIVLETVCAVLMEDEFRDWDRVGFVLQAYLRRTPTDLKTLLEWQKQRGTRVAVRLVKGAYWDTETVQGRLNRWPVPVWQEKESSDVCFESLAQFLLENTDAFYPAFASHNIRSLAFAMATAEKLKLSPTEFEIQALYGMAEPIKESVAKRGYLVREYAPVGELLPGMAYLVRRLLENTSNKGFIRQRFHEGESADSLLARPEVHSPEGPLDYKQRLYANRFENAPLVDFSDRSLRMPIFSALDTSKASLQGGPRTVHPIINGKDLESCNEYLTTVSPESPGLAVAKVGLVDASDIPSILKGLRNAVPSWKRRPQEERSALMESVARRLEADRAALTAEIVMECGKPIAEADADVAEAIDFLNYYASEGRKLAASRELCGLDGETDHLLYEARGVAAVIAPWNFAIAIPCGMFAAALVTGNTAILKPAEQSMAIAERLFRHFLDAGVPAEVMAFAPGRGEQVGPALVESPLVDTIAFTGSRAVGLSIIQSAATWQPGQRHIKRVIAEMGGKNAIIVDESADFDQAIQGILESAYGFAGQKCSACSRVFVHQAIYPRFKERLIEAVRSLVCGPASLPEVDLGPVIDEESYTRLSQLVERLGPPDAEGSLHPDTASDAWCFPPTLYCDVDPESEFMREEWFGPVLGICAAPDFPTAIQWANASAYALTGGVFSRSPANLEYAAREFSVGNLYLNRNCTGALVGRQPFGGAALSGIGSKAGGPDYLLQFTVPRVVTENTLRQGFAPMEES
jgi:RHH-type proline utilization regulon transcriptional repressor/proline dehydrogenase/delta 1-pyrroline-5-carboxylate dehydrogenase